MASHLVSAIHSNLLSLFCRIGAVAIRSTLMAAVVILSACSRPAYAASATWDGDSAVLSNGLWANSINWAGVTPVPGTGDAATFNNAGGGFTTIDLGSGVVINTVIFDMSSAAAYTIGAGAANNQTLNINDNGAIMMNATVAANELFNSTITLGTAIANAGYIFTNNSTTNTLNFAGNIQGGTGGTAGAKTLTFSGVGNTTIGGNISNGGGGALALTLNGSGVVSLAGTNTQTGTTTITTGSTLRVLATSAMSSSSQLTMQPGSFLQLRADANSTFTTSVYNPAGGSSTTIDVNQLTGAGNSNVITLASVSNFTVGGNGVMTLNVTGGNGDSLKINGNANFSGNANNGWFLNPTTANLTIAGNAAGSGAAGQLFTLDGTSSGNVVSGVISNTVGLTKSNSSTWALSGANTFSGATNVTGGTLDLLNSLALQNSPLNNSAGTVVFDAAATTSGTAFTVGGLAGPTNLVMKNSSNAGIALTLNPGAGSLLTFSGTLTDAGSNASLVKTGAGAQILTNAATYTGGTQINVGVLEFGGATSNMPATGAISVASGAAIAVNIGGAGEYSLSGTGAGTFAGLMGNGTSGVGGPGNAINYASGAGVGVDTTNGGDQTYGGTIISGMNFVKLGTNSLILTSGNAVTGTTTVLGGAVQSGNANSLASSAVTVSSANGLTFSTGTGTFNVGSLAGAGNEALADIGSVAVNLSAGANNASTTYSGVLSGPGFLTKTGTGILTLSGVNTYTGGTTISNGVLRISANSGLGGNTAPVTINGGTLNVTQNINGANFTHPITIGASGGTIQVAGVPTNTATVQVFLGNNNNTDNSPNLLLGTGTLTVTGDGSLHDVGNWSNLGLNNSNTFNGNVVIQSGGGFEINHNNAIGTNGTVTVNSNGELVIDTGHRLANAVTINGGGQLVFGNGNQGFLAGPVTLTGSGGNGLVRLADFYRTNAENGNISGNLTGSGGLTVSTGGAGTPTLNLLGATSYTGTTVLNSGASLLSFEFGSRTYANVISGAGGFGKSGPGTLTLTGTNLYTGTTTVSGGTLQVGNGTIGNQVSTALTFNSSGGTYNVNEAIGSSQFMGALTFSAGEGIVQSTYPGISSTLLTFSNVVARTAGATGNFVSSGGANGTSNKIIFTQVAGAAPTTAALLDKGYFFNGADYAAYDAGGFVRALAYGSDTNASALDVIAAGKHTKLTTSVTGQSSVSLLTLNLSGSGTSWSQNASQTLTLSGGGLIKSGGGTVGTISGGTNITTGGAVELVVRTDTASDLLNISVPITGSSSGLTKSGLGTLTLSATGNSYTGATTVDAGTLTLSGTYTGGSAFTVRNSGVLNINGASNGNIILAPNSVATANVSAAVTLANGNTIQVGSVLGGTGILNISTGANITGGNSPINVGTAGFGVINVTGGTVTPGQFLVAGITNAGATGIWNVSGGQVLITPGANNGGTLGASLGATGYLNIFGTGNYTANNNTVNGASGIFVGEQGYGVLNVYGGGTMSLGGIASSAGLDVGRADSINVLGIVNLGAIGGGSVEGANGTITTNIVRHSGAHATGIFNFHGGTLKPQSFAAGSTFFTGLTAAYVYADGGIIDNNAQSITIGQNFLAPTGNGVSAIATSGGTGYATAPAVWIAGGGGTGATAYATIDGSGNLTGITMTNQGTGYTSTPTILLTGGGGSGVTVGTITTLPNSSGGLTFAGNGTTTLSGASTYTGVTTVTAGTVALTGSLASGANITGGTLQLSGTGSLAGSVNINGSTAKLLQTSSTPIAQPVTLTSGTLDGTTSIGSTVTVLNALANTVANGNGTASQLTINSLVLNGAATMNLTINATSSLFTPPLTTSGLNPVTGGVKIKVTNSAGLWNNGTYDLIGYGAPSNLTGLGLSGFPQNLLQLTPGIGGRTSAVLFNDTSNNAIALQIAGDNPVWTGIVSGNWTTNPITPNGNGDKNWKLITGGTPTDFQANDAVLFDDTVNNVGGTPTISISDADVSVTSVTFNNSGANYVINGPHGILGATATMSITGSGSVTLASPNAYGGGTTIGTASGGGTLNINNNTALGTGSVTFASAPTATTLDNTDTGVSHTLTNNNVQIWNNDLYFAGSNPLNLGAGNVTLGANRTVTVGSSGVLTVNGNISDGGHSYSLTVGPSNTGFQSTGTLVLGGINTYTGPTLVNGGTLTMTGSLGISPATAAGQITVNNSGANAVLNLNGANVNIAATSSNAIPNMGVGGSGPGAGAVYQSGGTVTMPTTTGANLQLGFVTGGFGYYGLSNNGNLNLNEIDIGGNNVPVNGNGVMDISSGTVNIGAWITMSRGQAADSQVAVLNMTGGTINIGNPGGGQISMAWGGTDTSVINIKNASIIGPSTINYQLDLNRAGTAGSLGVVNLNAGGLLQIGNIIAGTAITTGANSGAFLNFNGGTLKATTTNGGGNFLSNANISGVYVYSGGGTIDNNGTNITIGRQLLLPTGNGVTDNVTVDNGGTGYISPPAVAVQGDGMGATAVAEVSNGTITAIHITNPGVGYTSATLLLRGGGGDGNLQYNSGAGLSVALNSGSGGMTFQGSGVTTITGNNTYNGATTISAGTVRLNPVTAAVGGTFNGSSGININGTGAKLLQLNINTAVAPTVTVTNGTLDGTGTVNTAIVGNGSGGIVANGNGSATPFTINTLTFNGAATVNLITASTSPVLLTTALSTSGGGGTSTGLVTVNASNNSWTGGLVYDLIGYSTLSGPGIGDFLKGTISGLTPRQTSQLVNDTTNHAIALQVNGNDKPVWTGIISNSWTTATITPDGGGNKNWTLHDAGTPTDFITNDSVIFDDTATNATGTVGNNIPVVITDASVATSGVTFNNTNTPVTGRNYTISGGFISSGFVTMNGTGSVTLSSSSTYAGGTTVNAGTLIINNASAIGTGALTMNGGTLNSATPITLSTNNAQAWNGDFSFAGTNNLIMGTGAVTLGGTGTARSVTVSNGQFGVGAINESTGGTFGLTVAGAGTLVVDSSSTNAPNGGGAQSNIAGLLTVNGKLQIGSAAPANVANVASDFHANGGLSGNGTISDGASIVRWIFVTEPTGANDTFSGVLQNGGTGGLGLEKLGAGTLTLSGTNTYTDTTTLVAGTLNVTGAITSGTGNQIIVSNSAANAVLKIAGTVAANNTAVGQFGSSLIVGTVAGSAGTVQMSSGTLTVAEQIGLGNGTGSYASLNQSGGNTTAGSFVVVGFQNDRSRYAMSGGTLQVNNNLITIAAGGTGSIGEMDLSGNASVNSTATTGNGATIGGIYVGEIGTGTLNISGNAAISLTGWGLRLGHNNAAASGTVNVDGGTITTVSVSRGTGTGVINFNGGTLRASADRTDFMPNLTSATIYSGGLTIDTNNHAITVAQPLLAPTGYGVTNPASSVTVSGGGYIDAPLVQVSGGSGAGATAVATINSNGDLTGINITNPGTGYQPGDFVSFTLVSGSGGIGNTGSVSTVASNVTPNDLTGGLTKNGAGTLTLSGSSTFSGPTTVNQGTLTLGVDNAISATSQVVLNGSTLATGGHTQAMTSATLKLSANSTLDFGNSNNLSDSVNFADSHTVGWTGGTFLRINNWNGNATNATLGGGVDQLFVGVGGLSGATSTTGQRGQVHFTGYFTGSQILGSGELVPGLATQLIRGDVNQDGVVTIADVSALMATLTDITDYENGSLQFAGNFVRANHAIPFDYLDFADVADANHDGLVNNLDIQAEINGVANGGVLPGSPPSGGSLPGGIGGTVTPVPEPASFVLLGLGGIVMLARRWQRNSTLRNSTLRRSRS